MSKDETLGVLALFYALAFLIGSMWDVLFPSHGMPEALTSIQKVLPEPEKAAYYIAFPILSGLFYGTFGIVVSVGLGYQNNGIFNNLLDFMRTDFLEGQIPQEPLLNAGMFTCYGAYFLLAVSGSTLGACFSHLEKDPRAEMLVSMIVYLLSAAYITHGGGCG
jgi:hypothetical protein